MILTQQIKDRVTGLLRADLDYVAADGLPAVALQHALLRNLELVEAAEVGQPVPARIAVLVDTYASHARVRELVEAARA